MAAAPTDAAALAKANEPVPDMVKQFVVYFYRHIREKNGASREERPIVGSPPPRSGAAGVVSRSLLRLLLSFRARWAQGGRWSLGGTIHRVDEPMTG